MNRVSDTTVGDLGKGISRYLPYICTVVACLLIVTVLPAENRGAGRSPAQVPVVAQADAVAGDLTSDTTGPGTPTDELGGPGRSTIGGTAGRAVTASPGKWPGVGSPEALSAPDCDPTTGRLKIPSVYAPPCVPMWSKKANNGGGTARGVTDREILVVFRDNPPDPQADAANRAFGTQNDPEVDKKLIQDWINLWQAHTETYGRKVKLYHFVGSGTSAEAQRADAIRISQELKPFATFAPQAGFQTFAREMAARGTIALTFGTEPQITYQKMAPYLWTSDNPAPEDLVINLAEYLGKRLWGRPTRWAGDPLMQQQVRKFGAIYYDTQAGREGLALFERELARYGAKLTTAVGMSSDAAASTEQSQAVIAKMKEAGVTVVVPMLIFLTIAPLTKQATSQNYLPEWLMSDFGGNFFRLTARTFDQTQSSHMYGVTGNPLPIPIDYWEPQRVFRWEYGADAAANPDGGGGWRHFFFQSLMLFNGIQLAGPNLTPGRFRDALFSLPPSGGAARGAVATKLQAWGDGIWPWTDYSGSDDFAEAWWSNTAQDQNGGSDGTATVAFGASGPGVFEYLARGKRHRPGQWPATEPDMFNEQTAVVSLAKPPDSELPSYPNMKIRGQ